MIKSKIDVLRAVMAAVSQRALMLTAILGGALFVIALLLIWALAYFTSEWWWLLLIVYVPLLLGAVAIFTTGRFLIQKLYSQQLSREQKVLLNNFTDKIQRLLETRGIGWPLFALLNVKDIVFHRELRTTKKLVSDTTGLKRDFAELEKKLQA